MREIPHIDEIVAPEYYHEVELYDCRVAIRKLMDVYNTLYEAATSIVYSDIGEYTEDSFETRIIRRSHLRHAVVDLNNCFDLLLQVPWFYYRIGLDKNPAIQRNSDNWVSAIAKECRANTVINELRGSGMPEQIAVGNAIKSFQDSFIFNDNKAFTIRKLANHLKHNGSMPITEFEEPIKFNLKAPKGIDTSKLQAEFTAEFFEKSSPETSVGKIKIIADEYVSVDIEYYSGEKFNGKDYSYYHLSHSFKEIFDECVAFYDEFLNLLEVIYQNIYINIPTSIWFDKSTIKTVTSTIDLNKWYKKS